MADDWFDHAGRGAPVDVGALFDSKVPVLLGELVQLGALVSVGTTSDGGACGITVTLDGRWRREYFREADEAGDWLAGAVEAVRSATSAQSSASSGTTSRRRRSRERL